MIVDIDAGQEFILQPNIKPQKITIRLLSEDSVRLEITEMEGLDG